MEFAVITFANNDTLGISAHDILTPILNIEPEDGRPSIQRGEDFEVGSTYAGSLIPDLISFVSAYQYFFVNNNYAVVYGTSSIVKVESREI